MDFNWHMRNTAYLDKAADVRMMFFAAQAFPMSEFVRLKIGPVVHPAAPVAGGTAFERRTAR